MRPSWRFEHFLEEEWPHSIVLAVFYNLAIAWWWKPLEYFMFWIIEERPQISTSETQNRSFKTDDEPEL